MRRSREAGVTLMEVLIAVTLLSLLSVGILMAMRVGLNALDKANNRLMDNRRVAGTQRILQDQLQGLIPVGALCNANPEAPLTRILFFEGSEQSLRFVSSYSLQGAARGTPQILEYTVIPTEDNKGVRLVVNEHPYAGPKSSGAFCTGMGTDPESKLAVPQFIRIEISPSSFVLADRLQFCRFVYLEPARGELPERWVQRWVLGQWPLAIRIEMASLGEDAGRMQPVTVTAPLRLHRLTEIDYVDY